MIAFNFFAIIFKKDLVNALIKKPQKLLFILWMGVLFFMAGCETIPPPIEEYTLARAAIEAAKSVQAGRHSPGYWHQAEESYRRAKNYYQEREWKLAKKEFIKARLSAEKAENSARLIRQKTGDVL